MFRKILMAMALASGFAAAQENYSTWGSMRVLTVKPSGISSSVAKFPLLVRLTSAQADVFANSKGRGADIRFTKSDLTTRYPHQIERWDSAGQKAEIWVLVDSVGLGKNLSVKMLWNKSGAADSSKGAAVFNTGNGFVSVLHLGDSTGTNPRPNQVAGAPTGLLQHFSEEQDFGISPRVYAPVEGVIGKADVLRGGNMNADFYPGRDYIDLGRRGYAGFSDFTTGFYFSTWFNLTNSVQYERFLEMNDDTVGVGSSAERIILFGNHTTAAQDLSVRWGTGGLSYNEPNGGLYSTGVWTQVVYTKDPGTSPVNIYVNGALVATSGNAGDAANALRQHVVLGRPSVTQGDPFFSGMLDESVLSKTSRSAAWIKLSYETQKTGATAVTVGSTTTPAAGGNDYTGLSGASASARTAFAATAAGRQVVFSLAAANAAGRVSVVDVQGRVLWTRTVDAGVASVAWD
ncbi:MAG TPA: DUF2341 domain-containing protein, partial [Fibrobacteria bacterium]|nr:DUF2341 domain-containing protein [Fibrobacteria bacterium]